MRVMTKVSETNEMIEVVEAREESGSSETSEISEVDEIYRVDIPGGCRGSHACNSWLITLYVQRSCMSSHCNTSAKADVSSQ
jgi:hypothetical protein